MVRNYVQALCAHDSAKPTIPPGAPNCSVVIVVATEIATSCSSKLTVILNGLNPVQTELAAPA
jgi:hypothetical protein